MSRRLFIAEKPALGRAIAAALGGRVERGDGHLRVGDDVITWCFGHLLALLYPEEYDPALKFWKIEDLPLKIGEWRKRPRDKDAGKHLRLIRKLVREAGGIVHAGDPGREGQLIVDEVLEFIGNRKPVKRILICDTNPDAVRRELSRLQENSGFRPGYEAALCRERSDWVYGMNLTRAYTLQMRRYGGGDGVFSVGRVQSPLLAIIADRERAIRDFRPKDYFVVIGRFELGGDTLSAEWVPDPDRVVTDEEGRVLDRRIAEGVARSVKGGRGIVSLSEAKEKKTGPPLPWSLSALQIEASTRFGLDVSSTLKSCQSLYESGYATYPRTDCRYYPEERFPEAGGILDALKRAGWLSDGEAALADPSVKGRAWNSKKLSEHHAIMPTEKVPDPGGLEPEQRQIYDLICRRYAAQMCPPRLEIRQELEILVSEEKFRAAGRKTMDLGWSLLEGGKPGDPLPVWKKGDAPVCVEVDVDSRITKPPKRFTQGGLISVMSGVARFVTDERIRKRLRDTDGLGTEATRAGIIDTLFERDYIRQKSGKIHATERGMALDEVMDPLMRDPGLTALMEQGLEGICEGKVDGKTMLEQAELQVGKIIERIRSRDGILRFSTAGLAGDLPPCPECGMPMRRMKSSRGEFLGCSAYPSCRKTMPVPGGKVSGRGSGGTGGKRRRAKRC